MNEAAWVLPVLMIKRDGKTGKEGKTYLAMGEEYQWQTTRTMSGKTKMEQEKAVLRRRNWC